MTGRLPALAMGVVLPLLTVAVALALVRLVRGPHLADRVVALDLLAAIGIGVIAAYAVATDESALLDVATVLALLSFLATVAFATYIRRSVS